MFMKGQYFSFDAIVASVIFMMAVVMLLNYWHSVRTFLEYQSGDISREAMRISAMLFSPPSPATATGNNCRNMQTIGLFNSFESKQVNETTLDCLQSAYRTDPAGLKSRFATPYEVTIKVSEIGGGSRWTIGQEPQSQSEIVKIRRIASIVKDGGSTMAAVDVYLYRQ